MGSKHDRCTGQWRLCGLTVKDNTRPWGLTMKRDANYALVCSGHVGFVAIMLKDELCWEVSPYFGPF